jgi:hypothetical protein
MPVGIFHRKPRVRVVVEARVATAVVTVLKRVRHMPRRVRCEYWMHY